MINIDALSALSAPVTAEVVRQSSTVPGASLGWIIIFLVLIAFLGVILWILYLVAESSQAQIDAQAGIETVNHKSESAGAH